MWARTLNSSVIVGSWAGGQGMRRGCNLPSPVPGFPEYGSPGDYGSTYSVARIFRGWIFVFLSLDLSLSPCPLWHRKMIAFESGLGLLMWPVGVTGFSVSAWPGALHTTRHESSSWITRLHTAHRDIPLEVSTTAACLAAAGKSRFTACSFRSKIILTATRMPWASLVYLPSYRRGG